MTTLDAATVIIKSKQTAAQERTRRADAVAHTEPLLDRFDAWHQLAADRAVASSRDRVVMGAAWLVFVVAATGMLSASTWQQPGIVGLGLVVMVAAAIAMAGRLVGPSQSMGEAQERLRRRLHDAIRAHGLTFVSEIVEQLAPDAPLAELRDALDTADELAASP